MPQEPSTAERNPADAAALAAAADPAVAHARSADLRPDAAPCGGSLLDVLAAEAAEEEPERWDGLS